MKLTLNKHQLMRLQETGTFTCPTESGERVEITIGDSALKMLRRTYGPSCVWPVRPGCTPD